MTLASFDPAEYLKLPDPGGYIPRKGKPCGECGETAWLIVRTTKSVEALDRTISQVVSVSCQCPNYYAHRREQSPRGLVILGRFDVVVGEMVAVVFGAS